MKYRAYQHIEKLGSSEVEGILNGTCYLSYKIDGTNSCVWLKEDGELGFGSRKRELSLANDNVGFMHSFSLEKMEMDDGSEKFIVTKEYLNLHDYLYAHPNYILYGEWLVPHTIKRYNKDAWEKLYIFDVYDAENNRYINYDIYSKDFDKLGINYVPLIAKLENPTEEDIKKLLDSTGNYLLDSGLGEGIVIKNYDYHNRYGHIKWAKVLTEDFRAEKASSRSENAVAKQENGTEHEIINLMTPEHIQKEYCKLVERYGSFELKHIFELLNRVFNEFIRDNWEIILKKFHLPTINFKVLKQMSDKKVKEVLGL